MTKTEWNWQRRLVHIGAVLIAGATLVLLWSGGLVTSHGAGMSVPDWPTSFGYNMFAFPVSRWVGGIFFEHVHRLIASGIGFLSIILAVSLALVETRKWVKVLGWCILIGVIIQGVLGGLRVALYNQQIGIFHGLLAQAVLLTMAITAIVTSRSFLEKRWAEYSQDRVLARLALAATILIYCQLGLGSTMRHQHLGLSIPDFPAAYGQFLPDTSPAALEKINTARAKLAQPEPPTTAVQIWLQMVHRFMAVCILLMVAAVCARAFMAIHSVKIRRWAVIWLLMIFGQIGLGAWTIWSNKAADIATAHVAMGALILVVGGTLTLRLFCGLRAGDFAWPDGPKQRMMNVA